MPYISPFEWSYVDIKCQNYLFLPENLILKLHNGRTAHKGSCPRIIIAFNIWKKPTYCSFKLISSCQLLWQEKTTCQCGVDYGEKTAKLLIEGCFETFLINCRCSFYRLVSMNRRNSCKPGQVLKPLDSFVELWLFLDTPPFFVVLSPWFLYVMRRGRNTVKYVRRNIYCCVILQDDKNKVSQSYFE